MKMGAYREQLLRETYGGRSDQIYGHPVEETPSRTLALFKLKFMICLLLFAGFAYLSFTGGSIFHITADEIVEAVTDNDLQMRLSAFAESWN